MIGDRLKDKRHEMQLSEAGMARFLGMEVDKNFYQAAQEKMLAPAREEHKFEQLTIQA